MTRDILFLTQRIPYPPDKGDKIRSFHILRRMAQNHRVHLGCFIDDPHDQRHVPRLAEYCSSLLCLPLKKPLALARGAAFLAGGKSLSEGYFRDRRMQHWVDGIAANVNDIFIFCSSMAPYAFAHSAGRTTVMDMVDVDSEKWRAYAQKVQWPLSTLYMREAAALLALEKKSALTFDRTFLAGANEAALFLERAPNCKGRIGEFLNGVDVEYFDPALCFDNPYPGEAVTFTGAMDYEPNIEAVTWFVRDIFPQVRRRRPQCDFWIVGSNPSSAVMALARQDGVHVTGRVADMRPYLRFAACLVAPLRIARGLQNKVLEAMAMDRTVIATPQAWQGLTAVPDRELFLAENPADFSIAVLNVLEGRRAAQGARARILRDHQWSRNLEPLLQLFGDKSSGNQPAT